MSKTDKFNRMIEAFECDFSLIQEGKKTFAELDKAMKDSRFSLAKDMELMQELSTMLRYGQAEIHIIDENQQKTNCSECSRRKFYQQGYEDGYKNGSKANQN
jgi:hypothetical protein